MAQLADGSAAPGIGVGVKVTINNDVTTLFEDELLSEGEEGIVTLEIPVPEDANCMKISVSGQTDILYMYMTLCFWLMNYGVSSCDVILS